MKIKTIIIEDEEPARNLILNYMKDSEDFELKAVCNDGFSGLKACSEHHPDLIFLDIQMPRLSGFELLEVLDPMPFVIFTTAYDEYALKAFEANAVDYLLKPFSRERFFEAVDKIRLRMNQLSGQKIKIKKLLGNNLNTDKKLERIVVKTGNKIHIINTEEIIYIESNGDYVMIYTEKGRFLKENTMKFYEKQLDSTVFIRIHRSNILNIRFLDKIELFEKETYLVHLKNGTKIKASLSGYKLLKNILNF